MTVNLPEDLERFVHDQVRDGRYRSEDDLISDAINRLKQAQDSVPDAPPVAPATTAAAAEPAWRRVLENMKAVPDAVFDRIPADSSEQLDHYLYGSPRRPTP
jgi:Arc/MetJ-type ribon-helix-helix transcriptional regulator